MIDYIYKGHIASLRGSALICYITQPVLAGVGIAFLEDFALTSSSADILVVSLWWNMFNLQEYGST